MKNPTEKIFLAKELYQLGYFVEDNFEIYCTLIAASEILTKKELLRMIQGYINRNQLK